MLGIEGRDPALEELLNTAIHAGTTKFCLASNNTLTAFWQIFNTTLDKFEKPSTASQDGQRSVQKVN